ncbi:MAG: sugar phosphate isomerase/epimerase family protein [Candidatus Latescibacterota bacterium]
MEKWATGIFTSIHGGLGAGLDAVRELGVTTVQLHAPTAEHRTAAQTRQIGERFAAAGITVTVVFVGFPDDDYSTTERVKQTVGLVPPGRRAARLQETLRIADFAAQLGVPAIGMHLGFVPPDLADPQHREVVEVTRQVCDHCRAQGQRFHLETGQETAADLLHFIEEVGRENLAVNFDPANMILYRAGQPLEALDKLGRYVRSVHCKDATWERQPGQPWHADAPLGSGDVDIEAFLRKLDALGYDGPLTIEREYSPDQKGDIAAALRLLTDLRTRILG